jgi:hypothetical protein
MQYTVVLSSSTTELLLAISAHPHPRPISYLPSPRSRPGTFTNDITAVADSQFRAEGEGTPPCPVNALSAVSAHFCVSSIDSCNRRAPTPRPATTAWSRDAMAPTELSRYREGLPSLVASGGPGAPSQSLE